MQFFLCFDFFENNSKIFLIYFLAIAWRYILWTKIHPRAFWNNLNALIHGLRNVRRLSWWVWMISYIFKHWNENSLFTIMFIVRTFRSCGLSSYFHWIFLNLFIYLVLFVLFLIIDTWVVVNLICHVKIEYFWWLNFGIFWFLFIFLLWILYGFWLRIIDRRL